ncbi:MAG: hypothetical protein P1P85_04700 [Patescibacteria group bacterium]|nr:hypothetical protein [Patescibacteria group bacterium]
MKVIFKTDLPYDLKAVWCILHDEDPGGTLNRAKSMKVSQKDLACILSQKKFNKNDKLLNKIVKERYKQEKNIIKKSIYSYQCAWDIINDLFSQEIEKITKTGWKYKNYFVILSPFNPGISSRKGNKVIRSCFEDSFEQRRITAHEILMAHIWNILDTNFKYPAKKEMQLWALNEMTAAAILSLEPSLNKIWGNNYENYLQNYPILNKQKTKIKSIYLKKKNFLGYLKEGINIIEKLSI